MDSSKAHLIMELLMGMDLKERLFVVEQFITNRQSQINIEFGQLIREINLPE